MPHKNVYVSSSLEIKFVTFSELKLYQIRVTIGIMIMLLSLHTFTMLLCLLSLLC